MLTHAALRRLIPYQPLLRALKERTIYEYSQPLSELRGELADLVSRGVIISRAPRTYARRLLHAVTKDQDGVTK
jgi:hypothetical protein